MLEELRKLSYSIARGVPQAATGFVDLAALPLTLSGMIKPEDVVGSTDYLTKLGLLPKPEQGLLPETTELVSSLLSPGGATKAALVGAGGLLGDAVLTSGALERLPPPVGSINPKGLLTDENSLNELALEARKAPSFEEFKKDFLREIKHGKYYHVTDNPNFSIDKLKGSKDMSSMGGGSFEPNTLMMTSDLDNWTDFYGKDRPFVVELDVSGVPREDYEQVNRGFGNEFFVKNADNVKIKKILPVDEAIKRDNVYRNVLDSQFKSDADLKRFYENASAGLPEDAARLRGADLSPVGSVKMPKGLLSNEFNLEKRFARAKEQGFDTDNIMYHGSTFDIKEFGGQPNPESAFGSGYYFTSNPEDASVNYAGEGPDLTNRILRRAEELESDEIPYDEAKKIAKGELKGTADEVVYPVVLRTKNSFDIRKNGTNPFLDADYPDPFEQDRDYWLKQTDGDIDEARELAEEARFDYEPEGAFVDFYESVMNNPSMSQSDREEFASRFGDYLFEGISAKELDKQFQKLEIYPEGENAEFVKNEVYRQGLQDAGFDSVKHDADRFPNMKATEGTEHTIIFDAENIRSTQAEFDPKKQKEKDILSFNQGLLGIA